MATAAGRRKIQVKNPIVEMDGDEVRSTLPVCMSAVRHRTT